MLVKPSPDYNVPSIQSDISKFIDFSATGEVENILLRVYNFLLYYKTLQVTISIITAISNHINLIKRKV